MLYVSEDQAILIGLVLTIWRIGKKRKPMPGACLVEACYCFRVAELAPKEDRGSSSIVICNDET